MSGIAIAPFTEDQVESLNAYQDAGVMHPFTCPNDRMNLVATDAGWICRHCDYTQEWAHEWMANDGWRQAFALPEHAHALFSTPRPDPKES